MEWVKSIIVCVFALIMIPIEKRVCQYVTKKWLALIITFVIGIILVLPCAILYRYLIEE